MARPRGTRSSDFDAKRNELLDRLGERLAATDGPVTGMRALAEAVGVTYPTLRHYFGSRDGILTAIFDKRLEEGAQYLAHMEKTELPFANSIAEATRFLVAAAGQTEFMVLHEIGLREGLNTRDIGSHYLGRIFEPTLQAIERRLQLHVDRGEMRDVDIRNAALTLLSPLLLGALHQHSLDGATLRPLSMDKFGDQLADTFVRAFAELNEAK